LTVTTIETVQRECDRLARKVKTAQDGLTEATAKGNSEAANIWMARRDALAEGLLCLCRVKRALLTGEGVRS
jgi:hypothetical protein